MKTHKPKQEGAEIKLDFDLSYFQLNSLSYPKKVSTIETPLIITEKCRNPLEPENDSKKKGRKQNLNQRHYF